MGAGLACELVDLFLTTEFEGGRHQRRVDLITKLEEKGLRRLTEINIKTKSSSAFQRGKIFMKRITALQAVRLP